MFDIARLTPGLCAAAAIVASGIGAAFAQETIAPASATPAAPMPEVLQRYTPVTAARLRQP